MFDKNQKLGMIAPIWADFPEKALQGFTSILLQLSNGYDERELLHEIRSLDARLLVFLRKLRQVNLSIFDGDTQSWTKTLSRHDEKCAPNQQYQLMKLQNNLNSQRYAITRFSVLDMPSESKRTGCNQTEIILAFPFLDSNEAILEPQQVYAFLPIRDYGFKVSYRPPFLNI
jgi:hypothetical protein